MKDLKEKAIRGGFARVCAQTAFFALRIGALMILARLLDPKDFGLVGMVMAFTGVLTLFRDFGLSTATVQRAEVSDEQLSTLFWINILVGVVLTVSLSAMAPIVVRFYREPRLFWVTIALSTGFIINAAGVQHSALLQRQMRFTALAVIQIIALVVSTAVGIGLALVGYGYWALVAMSVGLPLISTIAFWVATSWIPGKPRTGVGVRSMMHFGGGVTIIGVIVYIAYNLDKVLLGRFWGAEALGIYGRSFQIINIPTDNLNSAVGEVAFAALSRVQDDPIRLRNYFLKGYSLVLAMTVPMTCVIAIFPQDLIRVILGPKWNSAATILQCLAPTILIFAIINPLGWLLYALGMIKRSVQIASVLAPVVITGYALGLHYGPKGIALGFSIAMTLWALPHIAWGVYGTPISFGDIMRVMVKPLLSGTVAVLLALVVQFLCSHWMPIPRLLLGVTILLGVYVGMLFYGMGQKSFYVDLVRGLIKRPSLETQPPPVIQEA
jgi:PST family polysaccharide transporter